MWFIGIIILWIIWGLILSYKESKERQKITNRLEKIEKLFSRH